MRTFTFSGKITKIESPSYGNRVAASQRTVYEFDMMHLPKIKASEYIFIRVRACSSDVPNKNGDCFPYDELKATYSTFLGKGVYQDHQADSIDDMRGLILDAVFKEDPVHGSWVELLLAIDKSNRALCRKILKGQITDVSMGCVVREGICSICGNVCRGAQDEYGRPTDQCVHLERKGSDWNGQPVYEMCRGVEFIEISLVTDGADPEALILDANIEPSSELPDDLLSALDGEEASNIFRRSNNQGRVKVANTDFNKYSNYLVRELPTTESQGVFEMCRTASPERYWTVYQDLQEYPLRRAVHYLKTLIGDRSKELDAICSTRNMSAAIEQILMPADVPTLQELADDYLTQSLVDNPNDPSVLTYAVAYVLGRYEEILNHKNDDPVTIFDINGIATSVVQDAIEDYKRKIARTKQSIRTAAKKKVTKLKTLKADQDVLISDSEYGFTDIDGVVHSASNSDEWIQVMAEIGDSYKLVTIYQSDVDSGIAIVYIQ